MSHILREKKEIQDIAHKVKEQERADQCNKSHQLDFLEIREIVGKAQTESRGQGPNWGLGSKDDQGGI